MSLYKYPPVITNEKNRNKNPTSTPQHFVFITQSCNSGRQEVVMRDTVSPIKRGDDPLEGLYFYFDFPFRYRVEIPLTMRVPRSQRAALYIAVFTSRYGGVKLC